MEPGELDYELIFLWIVVAAATAFLMVIACTGEVYLG